MRSRGSSRSSKNKGGCPIPPDALDSSISSRETMESGSEGGALGNSSVRPRKSSKNSQGNDVENGNIIQARNDSAGHGRLVSLEMRKLPVNVLLKPSIVDNTSQISEDMDGDSRTPKGGPKDYIRFFCLRPSFTIRTQLMLSFGIINVVTITVVVVVCVLIAILSGENIKEINTSSFQALERESQVHSARYVARSLDQRLLHEGEVNILCETVLDRFQGYPSPTDEDVPFLDMESGTKIYPVVVGPMPLDWQLQPNVDEENYEEHFQDRSFWKNHLDTASTIHAGFSMRGTCDPSVTNRTDPRYWPVCTDANNDISTGGVVAPSPMIASIHRKGSDIVPVLKALFESKEEMRDLGVFFSNNGAGASMLYPQTYLDTRWTYVSMGCEWMKQPNPYDPSRPIGTQQSIDQCHGTGSTVSMRDFNVLDTEWCASQALNPDRLMVSIVPDPLDNDQSWTIRIGKGIYDRLTKEFIGCTYVGISLLEIEDDLALASTITDKSEVSMIMHNEFGTVIASSVKDLAGQKVPVYEADLGLTQKAYESLFTLVDFESEWEPHDVISRYESFRARDGPFLVSAYPVPPIPDEFDPVYRPVSFVIMSTASDELFAVVRDVNEDVDEIVHELVIFTFVASVVGLAVATVIIFLMSVILTSPLNAMNKVANEIVNNFGDPTKEDEIGVSVSPKMVGIRCSPRTELDDVVLEFNRMVSTFSGRMMAKSEKGRNHEVANQIVLHGDLNDLYLSRRDEDFKYALEPPVELVQADEQHGDDASMIRFHHGGSNLIACPTLTTNAPSLVKKTNSGKWSPLFLWIVGLIGIPLLLVNITISSVVMRTVTQSFSDSVESAENFFLDVQTRALFVHSFLRADYLSSLTRQSTRDAYLLTRYSGWLLSEGISRSESFTEVTTGVEQCKSFSEDAASCPYVEKEYVCDCAWNQRQRPSGMTCSEYPNGSRDLQVPYWASESQAALDDGDRPGTLFPSASYSPETVAFWDDPFELPGWQAGWNASGIDTAYDRLRVISALPLLQVIYNSQTTTDSVLSIFVAFEADGMIFGYRGCSNTLHASAGHFRISEADSSKTRAEICPAGKYGYDPRCREWYDKGRRLAMQNQTFLHVTSPYRFAGGSVAQSATTPLIDPVTEEHLGQVLFDFYADQVFTELESYTFLSEEGFPFLVATQSDDDSDTVLAPGFYQNVTAPPISKQVLPIDFDCNRTKCIQNAMEFDSIVDAMKQGRSGTADFSRSKASGGVERVHMAYAPVRVKSFRPLDSSNFSRGVEVESYLIYSVALAEPEEDILDPFDPIEETATRQIKVALIVLCVLIVLSTSVVAYMSHQVATSISAPMIYLRDLLQLINSRGNAQQPPQPRRMNTSREVTMFSETMEMLFKLLRSANAAYYAGDLELAHGILLDAMRLFTRLGNKKAVGIANNNLGNVVFAMYQQMKTNKQQRVGGVTKMQLVKNGVGYYLTAIQLGEELSEEFHKLQGWSPACLEFTQHLANRYFNRGLFLLIAKDDHRNSIELEELGKRDLQIARDMDEEVISYGEETGWNSPDRLEKIFDVKISRARGYNLLLENGYHDEGNAHDVLDEALEMLKTAKKQESSPLFGSISIAGRMQALEIELMKYKLMTGDLETAAKVAVRCLVEDEEIFIDVQSQAIDILLTFIETWDGLDESKKSELKHKLTETRTGLEEVAEDQLMASLNDVNTAVSTRASSVSLMRGRPSHLWSFRQSGGRFVTMEDF